MSYPFPTFPLVNRVGITTPVANIDARYGPWLSVNQALSAFNSGLRFRGLTVGVYVPNENTSSPVVEYWYKDGVADNNLVLKQTGGGAGTDTTLTTFVTANSGNWTQAILELPSNQPFGTNNNVNVSQFGIVSQTVSADQVYILNSYTPGRTITFFISGNHETIKRHRVSGIFINTFLNGAGQSNYFYTFKNNVTKVTLTRPFITPFRLMGTAEIIRTDLGTNQGGLGYLSLEQGATLEQILQENGDRLVIRNFA
jgi:hypothetical protein